MATLRIEIPRTMMHGRKVTVRALAMLLSCAALLFTAGCARMPDTGVLPMKFAGYAELRRHLLQQQQDLEIFRLRGPFEVAVRQDHVLGLSAEQRVTADVYVSSHGGSAPLVILLHGYDNDKTDHAYQGMHLATWGLHTLVVQLPARGPWSAHGRTLAGIVELARRNPEDVFGRIDTGSILLAGHSFGASSVVHALAGGSPAAGAILLDPAAIGRNLDAVIARVRAPVMVIGADEEIFPARGRERFFRHLRGSVAEISIRNAGHDDAQFSLDDDGRREQQLDFLGALTAAAFSLGSTGGLDYAWSSYDRALREGKLFDARKK